MEIARIDATQGSYTDLKSDINRKTERYAVAGVMKNGMVSATSKVHQNVHININKGLGNSYNLIWNKYDGAQVLTYNILRGSSASTLTQIESLSGSNSSYTDYTSDDKEPFYAIEYVLKAGTSRTVQGEYAALKAENRGGELTGRSNIANSDGAYNATYVSHLSILSFNNKYELTEEKPAIYLFAEILPINSTYKSVIWEIIEGDDLASIEDGLLIAKPNTGGTVTVKATAIDGSEVSATKQITVEAFGNPNAVEDIYAPDVNNHPATPDRAVKYFDERGNLFLLLPDGRKFNSVGIEVK